MYYKLRAIADQIICVRQQKAETEGGIIIPTTSQKQNLADVVSVGPECQVAKPGDVIYLLRPGTDLDHDGKTHTLIKEKGDWMIIMEPKK